MLQSTGIKKFYALIMEKLFWEVRLHIWERGKKAVPTRIRIKNNSVCLYESNMLI